MLVESLNGDEFVSNVTRNPDEENRRDYLFIFTGNQFQPLQVNYLTAALAPFQKEVSITVLRIPSHTQREQRFLKDPGCWKNQQMKRFEDNEPTKVLKDDCVRCTRKRRNEND